MWHSCASAACFVVVAVLALPAIAAAQLVMGSGPGANPVARVLTPGDDRTVQAYAPSFIGGVNVALGDVDGDGTVDVITGAGPGGGPHVRVLSGVDFHDLHSFFAFAPTFRGGVSVAAGDIDGDGRADIIAGAGPGGSPQVRVFSGVDLHELQNFQAYGPTFRGGVHVAAGDIDGDGRADIVTGAGAGGGPHVRVFSGVDLHEVHSFFAYDPAFRGGVYVAAGDVDGDGRADLVTGAGPGGGPHVRVFSGVDLHDVHSFLAYAATFRGGVRVAAGDLNGDGRSDVITGAGSGAPQVRVFNGVNVHELMSFLAFSAGSGVSVASTGGDTGLRFSSASSTSFPIGSAGTFTVTTIGAPTPALTSTGVLPAGVTFVDNGDGTATLAGTPGVGTSGEHSLSFTATNGVGTPVTQNFTLTVTQAPAITSAGATMLTVGIAGTFTVTTTGVPVPSLTIGGAGLPGGVTFVDNGNGTGTLSGMPAVGTGGVFPLQFTATNSVGSSAPQAFTLTVNTAPAFASATTTTFAMGVAGSFTVTAVGTPVPALGVGALPGGVTFVDNFNGSGTLSGTPGVGTAGAHALTFTATNGVGGPVAQTFTLTITESPVITSASSATFALGAVNTFTVTASGFPAPSLVQGGAALPSGVTWVDNGDGTGTLSGTPSAGTGGSYALTFTAANGSGSAVQNFTLTVSGSPGFTSAATTTFTVGTPGTFTVTAIGAPAPAITVSGTLPSGVTFVDNGGGSGTLSGTPAAGTGGTYALTFTAANGVLPDGTQAFTLNVNEGPTITSAASATFTIGTPGSFTVTTSGLPLPTLASGGVALPAGVTFVDNGNGTGTLSGTPAAGTGGTYAISFTATNTIGSSAPQAFTLTVSAPPTITSANTTTFTVGTPGTFTVTATGSPTPAIAVSGSLPAGVTFLDNGNGTGTLSGTPGASTGGSYALTFTASNGVLPNGTQAFTLIVNQVPAITSANATTFTVGSAGSFNAMMTGFPAPTVSVTAGTLPAGVTLTSAGVLSGTPDAGTGGTYNVTLTATNGIGANALQSFTLTVNQAPAITSADTATFVLNTAGTTFQVVMTGVPAPTVSVTTGTLPTGLTLSSAGLLSGTPTQSGSFPVTLTATNGTLPNATQNLTVAVNAPPAITSANNTTFTVGVPGTFTVTTTGFPAPTVSESGTLPTGVTFTPGTKVLAGTATQTGAFPLQFTATNAIIPDAVQNFTLNVVCPAITVNPSVLPEGLYQTLYTTTTFTQTGSTGSSFTWSATGLPPGLTIGTSTSAVSGTPTSTVVAGAVVITVTDNFGCTGTRNTAITVRPVATNESYANGVGNTQFVVGATPPLTPYVLATENANVKTGDSGPGTLSVTFPATSLNGVITEGATDGTFTYTPAVGFTGTPTATDTFTYTLTDGNGVTNTATVTIALADLVWYVNNSGGNGDGRSHNPFNSLANAATPSISNSFIYVHTGGGAVTPTAGDLALDAIQTLQGAGGIFSHRGLTIAAGTRPTLSGTVTLANSVSIRDLNFAGAGVAITASGLVMTAASSIDQVNVTGGTSALSLTNVTATGAGAINVSTTTFTNTSGAEVLISQGNVPITFASTATISSNAGRSIDIQDRTGGTIAFNGPITDTGQGIFLDSNANTTINFAGGLALATTSFPAFTSTAAVGGTGTVSATQNNTTIVNTIATTTGTALNVANTTIGASGLTFRSISAGTGSGSSGVGVSLDTTGLAVGNGGLTITGNSAAGTGGTIQHKTGGDGSLTAGIGIVLQNTKNASFNLMQLNDFDNSAITGRNVNGFTLTNSVVNGTIGTTNVGPEGAINFGVSNPGGTNGLQGTGLIRNTKISGAVEHNVEFYNQSGSMTLTIDGTSAAGPAGDCRITSNSAALGSDGVLIEMQGSATATVTVQRCYFDDNKSQAVQASALDDSSIAITIDSSRIVRTAQGNEGFILSNASNADLTAMVSNNNVSGLGGTAIFVGQTAGNATASSQLHASVLNNVISQSTSATNHGIIAFLTSTVGQVSQARIRIDGNTVTNNSTSGTTRGILVDTPDANTTPNFHATVTNNSVAVGDNIAGVGGLVVQARQTAGTTGTANIAGNTVTFPNGNPGVNGLRARQVTAAFNLEQSASCTGTAAAVLTCLNPGATTEVLGTIAVVGAGSTLLPNVP